VTGAKMLGGIRSLRIGVDCVLHHHERWDGDGYPYGLAGATIPLEARIVSVADAFDAMISDRPYRSAMPREAALSEIDRCSGSQFDPKVASALLTLVH
jgi:HD-GYP domain-containing protein (c-di-GMP phosphodiesterase class II)